MADTNEYIHSGPEITVEIPRQTIGQILFENLKSAPADKIFWVEAESDKSVTCSEVILQAVKVAESLKEMGVEPEEPVLIAGKNGIDSNITAMGALFVGATLAPLDSALKPFEFQYTIKNIKPKIIFCDEDVTENISKALAEIEMEVPIVIFCADLDKDYQYLKYEEFLKEEVDMDGFEPIAPEDPSESVAYLVNSSGTTGLPKTVMLTNKALVTQIMRWKGIFEGIVAEQDPQRFWLHTSPFFWITGLSVFLVTCALLESRVLVRNVTPEAMMRAIDKYKTLIGIMVPAQLESILDSPEFDNYDLTSLKLLTLGGTALQKITYDKVMSQWKGPIFLSQGYGSSEVSGVITSTKPWNDISSVGEVASGCHIKVVNLEDGSICGPEETGEIHVKSASMMKGYLNNEEATREAIDEDGWLRTGDTGYFKDQVLYLTGRIKEMIKYRGKQIAPAEIEEVIRMIPGVADVGIAGIKVDSSDYHPMALVVKSVHSEVTEEDVVKCVNEKLSDHKQLRAGVCFVEKIPRTSTGKIKRTELQSTAEELYMDGL